MKNESVDTRIKLERHREDVVVTTTYLSDPHDAHAFNDIGERICPSPLITMLIV